MTSEAQSYRDTQGYRHKPKWIPIVALFFILTPFGNFLLTLASLNIPRWYTPDVWAYWVRYVPPKTWGLMGFIFVSGISLMFFVRTWALVLTLATLGLVLIYNLVMIKAFSLMGTMAVWGMTVATLGAGFFLYMSRFRKPYVNPKIRWWETSPRFRTDIAAKIEKVAPDGTLVDVSITGALLEWKSKDAIPDAKKITHIKLPPDLQIPCIVARATERGYGIHFDLNRADKKKLDAWLKLLSRDPTQISW